MVQSPEKLQATLADMAAAVDKERGAAAEAEKRLRGVHARSEQLTKVRALPDAKETRSPGPDTRNNDCTTSCPAPTKLSRHARRIIGRPPSS